MISRQTDDAASRTGVPWARGLAVFLVAVLLAGGLAIYAPPGLATRAALAALTTILAMAGLIVIQSRMRRRVRRRATATVAGVIENDSAPGFVTDANGVLMSWNRAAQHRFGDTVGGTLAGTLRSIFANPAAVLFRMQTRARGRGGASEDIVTRRGHVRVAVHGLGEAGFLWRIEELPDRAHPGRAAETLPVAMVTLGRSGAILFMNDAARAMTGGRVKTLEALIGDLPLRAGEVHQLITPDGVRDVLVILRDATAARRELFLLPADTGPPGRNLEFETLPVALLKVSVSGRILAVNRLARRLLGDAVRKDTGLSEVMQGLGRPVVDWLRDTAAGKPVHQSEFLRLNRRDREVFVQVTLSRVNGEEAARDGDGTTLIAVLSDATELKTLEAQFVQSQKMQAIGQLAGGVAHDFNNLLTAISGHCDLLLLRHDQGDQDYGDLVQIHQNANRAAALVGQLLAFSRKQTLRPEVLDLRDTLSDLTHLLNRLVGEKVTLTLSHDPVLKTIRADKRQLEQVLMNLVVNARDAMPSGGEIRIDTEVAVLRTELHRDRATVPPGEYVTVRVCDEGTGIPPDKLQKVFEPFYTTKRTGEGTGLGLSTAYGIVKQTGGFIFVDSTPGTGTCFTLYFPVHEEVAQPRVSVSEPLPATTARQGDGVVLLVEDEAPVRAFASRALRMRGYTVMEAGSAEEALKMLDNPELNVDVFVTDVVMPGMDGPSWVRQALEARPDVRVVFVSGYAEGAFGDDGPTVPNSVFLPKPFSLVQLTETVHRQLQ